MTTENDRAVAPEPLIEAPELFVLWTFAVIGLVGGAILLIMGSVDATPTWDEYADEDAIRAGQTTFGAVLAGLGFVAFVGVLVLRGVRRMLSR